MTISGVSLPSSRGPSVATRLALLLTVLLLLASTVAIYAAYSYGRAAADETYDQLLTGAALQISERISVSNRQFEADIPLSAFELLALAKDDRIFYRIFDSTGETVTGYDDFPLPPAGREKGNRPVTYETNYAGAPVRAVMLTRYLAEKGVSGPVRIIVAHTTEARTALARSIARRAMLLVVLAGVAVIFLAILAMRLALRPLDRIERAIIARDPLDLSPFTSTTPREVEALVGSINRFMERLSRRVHALQDFVADAAHQMRTPITAIRAQAELAVEEDDPERLKMLVRRIRARAIGVGRLTDQLLSHALVTHRSDTAVLAPLDLRRVALEAEREFRSISFQQNSSIDLDLPEEEVRMMGDAFSLKEAIKNLIANAYAHGKPPVGVAVLQKDGKAIVKVTDQGGGFSAADPSEIGKRFARNENKPESAGLGLAIVREVLVSHNGDIITGTDATGFWIGMRFDVVRHEEAVS